jgi:hypothetical protein
MLGSILAITFFVAGIFIPVLLPATVHAVHFAREWRPTYGPVRSVARVPLPRPVPFRRVAVPAVG